MPKRIGVGKMSDLFEDICYMFPIEGILLKIQLEKIGVNFDKLCIRRNNWFDVKYFLGARK